MSVLSPPDKSPPWDDKHKEIVNRASFHRNEQIEWPELGICRHGAQLRRVAEEDKCTVMAEEDDLLELFNESLASPPQLAEERGDVGVLIDSGVFVAIVAVGLAAHVLLVYSVAAVRRLQTRTNCVIAHWLFFEAVAHNVLYPLTHFWHAYAVSFTLHMMLADVLLLAFCCTLLAVHVLASDDALMAPDDAAFRRRVERFYATLGAAVVLMLVWKTLVYHQLYVEVLLIVGACVAALALAVRVLWRQCSRLIAGCPPLHPSAALRLHLATFFVAAKLMIVGVNVASLHYRSPVLVQLSRVWCLSGVYVLGLLVATDVGFRIGIREALGCPPRDADVDRIIISSRSRSSEQGAKLAQDDVEACVRSATL